MASGADFNKEEIRMARRDGATIIKNSGRGEIKGDAKKGPLWIDYKFTDKKSFALNKAEFAKLSSDAFKQSLEPVIAVIFDSTTRMAIMDWGYVLELHEELEGLRAYYKDEQEREMWS
jgi:C1A family cysteine protease